MGICNTFKQSYRAFVHTHMANMVFHGEPARMGIDHMRVCAWLGGAWNSLNNTKTVRLCFAKAGFLMPNMKPKMQENTVVEDIGEASPGRGEHFTASCWKYSRPYSQQCYRCLDNMLDGSGIKSEESESHFDQAKPEILPARTIYLSLIDAERFFLLHRMHQEAAQAAPMSSKALTIGNESNDKPLSQISFPKSINPSLFFCPEHHLAKHLC